MRLIWSTLLIFSFPFFCFGQQSKANDYSKLLMDLEVEVAKGNLIALRDLGSLLDKNSVAHDAQRIIKNYTFFLDNEWNWNKKASRQTFLDFFYNNKNEIRFFQPAKVFYIAALDIEKVKYEIHNLPKNINNSNTSLLRKHINAFETALKNNDANSIEKKLTNIISLDTRESKHYLLQIMQERLIQKSDIKGKINLIITTAQALQDHPSIETLDEILMNVKNGFIPIKEAKDILSHLTNHSVPEMNTPQQGVDYFSGLIDSLKTMENIRLAGYDDLFSFSKYIFPHDVDYFGRILGLADLYPWIKKNVIRDLINTEHERAFLYLAADFYKNQLSGNNNGAQSIISVNEYEKYFIKSNQLIIKVLNRKNKFENVFETFTNKGFEDDILNRNFLLFWMAHHVDFEWNQNYELFINKNEVVAKTENYEKLFRRLVDTEDEVALASFMQLTEGNPAEIFTLSTKYRQLLRSLNKAIPNFRHYYIEQLSELTNFCRNNNITYQLSNTLKQKLEQLQEDIPNSKRYELENRIINSLELNEITAVEYYSCIYENNNAFTFSIGRILDHFYSRHWSLVIQNDDQLRLYLKKAALFKRIGTIGSCNSYTNKLQNRSGELTNHLNNILEVEPDDDIIFLIESLATKEVVNSNDQDLQEFIDNPLDFSKNDIRVLSEASKKDFQRIINMMKDETDVKVITKYSEYLRRNPKIEIVPIYFQLINSKTFITKKYSTDITLADLMVPIIEGAYNHHFTPAEKSQPFATQQWRTLWETDGSNYKNWVITFFEQKLKKIEFAEKLKIDVLNNVFASEHYKEEYKKVCLEGLKKVRPIKSIKKLKTPEKLSVKEDLKYFEDFFFSYKNLDDIPKLFVVDDHEMLFDYLNKRTADFDESEYGTFWNSIFRQGWFLDFINMTSNRVAEKEKIKEGLKTYLYESDLISEYEEQTTSMNINLLESLNNDLITKLKNSIKSDSDDVTKALIQQSILARASYKDIPKVLGVVDQLTAGQNFQPYHFLQKDFGLPIFNIDDDEARKKVIKNHSEMSEYDFYKYYIKNFGVDFLNKEKLDFQKIYDLLQFEIVTPFVGGGGTHRDQFTYGLIKMLELNFETRLDFHEKLNENQTFYSFTSKKRAMAWRKYLVDSQLVIHNKLLPPSFNDVVKNN